MKSRFMPAALAASLLFSLPAFAAGSHADADGMHQSSAAITHNADAVRKVQQALKDDGYNVEANGKWDSATRSALREYQEDNGIKATGKLNTKTVQQLGLGDQAEFSAFSEEGLDDRDLSKQGPSESSDSNMGGPSGGPGSDVTREGPRDAGEGDTGKTQPE